MCIRDSNSLYWSIQEGETLWHQPAQEQLFEIRRGCQLFYGVTDATFSHDIAWNFSKLGRLIERADKTSRILDVKYFLLLPNLQEIGGAIDELQWISLLRSAGAYQMFRRSEQGSITPNAIARFLLLDPIFPRSVRFCLEGVKQSLGKIQNSPISGKPNDLECLIGLLLSKWSFIRIDQLIKNGLHEAIDSLQIDLNKLHNLIHDFYFINERRSNVKSLQE